MIIPPRIIPTGDKIAAKELYGLGKKFLAQHIKNMSFQTIDHLSSPTLRFSDGSWIKCYVSHGLSEIHIYSPPQGEEEFEEKFKCLCNCGFSVGQIIGFGDSIDEITSYDVLVCNYETDYIFYENILASDFTEYTVGQVVIVIPYNQNLYTCCTVEVEPTGCNPMKSTYDISSDDWRSTYRIIPWCGGKLPRWY